MNQQSITAENQLSSQNIIKSTSKLNYFEQDQQKYTRRSTKVRNIELIKRKDLDWNKNEKTTYGKVLLSYLIRHIEINSCFLLYIGQLLDISQRQVYTFHRKMLSEYGTIPRILSHILKLKPKKLMKQIQQKQFIFQKNLEETRFSIFDDQVQELKQSEVAYLENMLLVEDSLEHFQQSYGEEIEVFQLADDESYEKDQNTNDSIEEDNQEMNIWQ